MLPANWGFGKAPSVEVVQVEVLQQCLPSANRQVLLSRGQR